MRTLQDLTDSEKKDKLLLEYRRSREDQSLKLWVSPPNSMQWQRFDQSSYHPIAKQWEKFRFHKNMPDESGYLLVSYFRGSNIPYEMLRLVETQTIPFAVASHGSSNI